MNITQTVETLCVLKKVEKPCSRALAHSSSKQRITLLTLEKRLNKLNGMTTYA